MRRAGTGRLPGGRHLTWTVADGRRGRRWRSITTGSDGQLDAALLLEVGADGTICKLELAGPAGLLTLHPGSGQAVLHGNVVRPSGIEHITLPWSPRDALLVGASPITAAVAAGVLEHRVGVGEGASFAAVEVSEDLVIRRATWRAARVGERRWQLLAADRGPSATLTLDGDGIPDGLDAAAGWPLEVTGPT